MPVKADLGDQHSNRRRHRLRPANQHTGSEAEGIPSGFAQDAPPESSGLIEKGLAGAVPVEVWIVAREHQRSIGVHPLEYGAKSRFGVWVLDRLRRKPDVFLHVCAWRGPDPGRLST